ncbi:MAG: PD-(D/E)XK nuclease family protein [Rhodothermales bacterium]|nr:PD-(D/E)XK nuclease family protein [Rhodothermales bacterium]
MEIKKLSATSISRWLDCPASWKAIYSAKDRPSELSGSAAQLGSACHRALEEWVVEEHYLQGYDDVTAEMQMRSLYHTAHREVFGARGADRYNEGAELCVQWVERTPFTGEVLGTEYRREAVLDGVGITTIMDRVDRTPDGELEVVDYKTSVMRMAPDELHNEIQPRLYAWAASQIWGIDNVWVTLDQLRHQAVSSLFTEEDHARTEEFVLSVIEDIRKTEEPEEKLNSKCRFCVRRHRCATLSSHLVAGGPLSLGDVDDVIAQRYETSVAIKGLESRLADYDDLIRDHGEAQETSEWMTQDHKVVLWQGARSKRPTVRVKPL